MKNFWISVLLVGCFAAYAEAAPRVVLRTNTTYQPTANCNSGCNQIIVIRYDDRPRRVKRNMWTPWQNQVQTPVQTSRPQPRKVVPQRYVAPVIIENPFVKEQ